MIVGVTLYSYYLEVLMRKKVLCIVLALVMCMMVTMPAFADGFADAQAKRVMITATFGLKQISGSSYKMWAKINNPSAVSVSATLILYDASYNYITSVSTTSSSMTINLSKTVSLSSGTYHLRLSYTADGSSYSVEKTYTI